MITTTEYTNLDEAYDYFNAELFGGRLPFVLITLQRHRSFAGYFSPKRFRARHSQEQTDELALNPVAFNTPDIEILDTLVHEMCHVWQAHFGKPSRGNYHNKEFAAKMIEVGLMPSQTGKPGGKTTGQGMSDYIITGGRFEQAARKLLESGFTVKWMSAEALSPRSVPDETDPEEGEGEGENEGNAGGEVNPKNKVKYTCPKCQANAWGKPDLALLCGKCSTPEELVRMEAH